MNVRIGYIPYLNMAPFHHGFGPQPFEAEGHSFEFKAMSPRTLGLEAEKGLVDAGAMSLVDYLRLSDVYEPLGSYGIGLKQAAQSVLLFSKKPMSALSGVCAVTDETSTSYRLLQVILESRYGQMGIQYGRIPSLQLFDGDADALLLIGDEALQAKKDGVKGFPIVTDLGEEWFDWQKAPFVFARWVVRKGVASDIKAIILKYIKTSLISNINMNSNARSYWDGFAYELGPEHERSIALFADLLERKCLTA
jgi:chorismate dehydratase